MIFFKNNLKKILIQVCVLYMCLKDNEELLFL